MPHLRFRCVEASKIKSNAAELLSELMVVIEAESDWFTLEIVTTEYLAVGGCNPGNPFVEVVWFPRSEAIQQRVAEIITAHLQRAFPDQSIVVVFIPVERGAYYENGVHF